MRWCTKIDKYQVCLSLFVSLELSLSSSIFLCRRPSGFWSRPWPVASGDNLLHGCPDPPEALVMARLACPDHHHLLWSWSCFGLGLSLDLWWHALLVQIIIIYSGLQLTTVIKTDICFVHIFTIYRTEKIIFGWVWWHMDNLVYLPVSHDLILYMLILRVKIVALPLRTTKTTTHRMWSRGDGHNLNNP